MSPTRLVRPAVWIETMERAEQSGIRFRTNSPSEDDESPSVHSPFDHGIVDTEVRGGISAPPPSPLPVKEIAGLIGINKLTPDSWLNALTGTDGCAHGTAVTFSRARFVNNFYTVSEVVRRAARACTDRPEQGASWVGWMFLVGTRGLVSL